MFVPFELQKMPFQRYTPFSDTRICFIYIYKCHMVLSENVLTHLLKIHGLKALFPWHPADQFGASALGTLCILVSHRIHGAGIYANITEVYWWDPWHTIYSSTMDPMGIYFLIPGLCDLFRLAELRNQCHSSCGLLAGVGEPKIEQSNNACVTLLQYAWWLPTCPFGCVWK